MSNGSRAKWDSPAVKTVKPKPTYIDFGNKNGRRRKGDERRNGFCYVCRGSHLWGEPCQ